MLATAALLVLATTAQAASKYNYGGRGSYAPSYKMSAYSHEPSYESHYAEDDYREPDHDSYGGDAYSEEPSYTYGPSTKSRPSYKQSHEPRSAYRHKRSVQDGREGQQAQDPCCCGCIEVCNPLTGGCDVFCECKDKGECFDKMDCERQGLLAQEKVRDAQTEKREKWEMGTALVQTGREGQQFPSCIGLCATVGPNGAHRPCRNRSIIEGGRNFCYVSEACVGAKQSILNPDFLFSLDACCGTLPC